MRPPSEGARPSRTARAAALGRAVGFDGHRDTLAEQLLPWRDAALARRLRYRVDGTGRSSRLLRSVTGVLAAHTTLRMVAIDEQVRDAVAAGTRQVVILGAGLDTRAWRLPELGATRVLELDLPQTQNGKRLRLGGTPARAEEVRFVPVDLHRADLDWVLGHAGHDARDPTVWILEGLTMYLPHPSVRATLAGVAGRSAPGSRLAMTFAVPEVLGDSGPGRALAPGARAVFELLGEPLRTLLAEDEVRTLLLELGADDVAISDFTAWAQAAGLRPPPNPLAAERLAVADWR
jgi:methyltransferase (TIGR00027 family)